MLSDRTIRATVKSGRIRVAPFDEEMIQPASLDVRLGREVLVQKPEQGVRFDPKVDSTGNWNPWLLKDEGNLLELDEFMLGSTYEHITLPSYIAARFEGKSSLGRLGLMTHVTAGFIDPGFSGHITVELKNVSERAIVLYPGMKIGQLCFYQLETPAEVPYGSSKVGSHYQR